MGTCLFSLRFHEVLKALTDCDEGKLHILRVLYEFWKNHPEVGSFRLQILLFYSLIAHHSWNLWKLMLWMYSFRWSQCWWTSLFGPRSWIVRPWQTGCSLLKWLMISPGIHQRHAYMCRWGEVAVIDLCSLGLCRFYVWEILHSTIRKMNKHVQKIQKELDEAKEKLEKQQNKKVEEKPFSLPRHMCALALLFLFLGLTALTVTFVRV